MEVLQWSVPDDVLPIVVPGEKRDGLENDFAKVFAAASGLMGRGVDVLGPVPAVEDALILLKVA